MRWSPAGYRSAVPGGVLLKTFPLNGFESFAMLLFGKLFTFKTAWLFLNVYTDFREKLVENRSLCNMILNTILEVQ